MAAGSYGSVCGWDSSEEKRSGRAGLGQISADAARSYCSPLLVHPIKMVHRVGTLSKRVSIGNRRRDVGLCQERSFGQAAIQGKVTSHGGGESAFGAVGAIGTL